MRPHKQFPALSEELIQPQADVWLWHSCQALPAWMTGLEISPAKAKGGEDTLYSFTHRQRAILLAWPGEA